MRLKIRKERTIMPNWSDILNELSEMGSPHDVVRRQYLRKFAEYTGRNVIIYYSAWLQKPGAPGMHVTDADKNGLMAAVHKLDRSKGLDLVLHTPGGETAATESIVDYLRAMFGTNIRAVVPQLAMSAGTMISCACKEILMGAHSSLGPIDPQFGGLAAHGVCEEFERARREIAQNMAAIPLWQPIIAKYNPTLIGECEKAIEWSNEMCKTWLVSGMFHGLQDAEQRAERVLSEIGSHALTKSHARHLSINKCKEIGLKITALETDQKLQESVLSLHHACVHTLSATNAGKIIENQAGVAYIEMLQPVMLPTPVQVRGEPAKKKS